MAPRGFTLPPANTQSAKQARSAFFCSLCQKGYSRMNEFDAHESSYDHQHKKRLKDMKEMQRQVQPKKEEKGPLMQIKLGGAAKSTPAAAGGFKKGGFKNAFAPADDDVPVKAEKKNDEPEFDEKPAPIDEDSDVTDVEDYYDPRRPTGCTPACPGHVAAGT
ncbi:hypothetical protein LTR10_017389 [Elasticomyces elasticus]|uniref:C2H2-type domain-containing protein n=1 Tax=Exophiala sideris TaxID=1016849 RepID=A0ABR0J908_9EURO|nr:hypothetical protein LTR10_017389 [Elasticomyces elasticus]KAK5027855.1 hypothetical protein LTS07_006730 [Exophiala sideris]KAK5037556.1 hypothetical protein LTR13_004714 [Exophiala sideris]KAK5059217.1 hypothetical protein LTR69_006507 [Exophiala sideris]KAK5183051.1 hypothetical protein LTR44_004762 [Eurotiomycetes sp. CCFEE 6388]